MASVYLHPVLRDLSPHTARSGLLRGNPGPSPPEDREREVAVGGCSPCRWLQVFVGGCRQL